ncbi:MAG: ribosome biogenesis GTPase Der [Deltaproteobacteria bacterium]|jgi:ribosome-associated GTPase EngA|nr:ribosome biogenesis GTPase Der [Deltaproteobacteria bacterium]
MCALIALIGRPNVGKSSLFNRLAGRSAALVDDRPGVTRDRHYADFEIDGRRGLLVDTGGFDAGGADPLAGPIAEQIAAAVAECDLALLVTDTIAGLRPEDREIARLARRSGKPVIVCANKTDAPEKEHLAQEFHELGFDELFPVSAAHGYGTSALKERLKDFLEPAPDGAGRGRGRRSRRARREAARGDREAARGGRGDGAGGSGVPGPEGEGSSGFGRGRSPAGAGTGGGVRGKADRDARRGHLGASPGKADRGTRGKVDRGTRGKADRGTRGKADPGAPGKVGLDAMDKDGADAGTSLEVEGTEGRADVGAHGRADSGEGPGAVVRAYTGEDDRAVEEAEGAVSEDLMAENEESSAEDEVAENEESSAEDEVAEDEESSAEDEVAEDEESSAEDEVAEDEESAPEDGEAEDEESAAEDEEAEDEVSAPEGEGAETDVLGGLGRPPRLAVIGRPNAGKSSLINRLCGQSRLVTDSRPGTTRDALDVEVEHEGKRYIFVDTAGVRRRGKVGDRVEKISVMRAIKSLDRADTAILLIDAVEGLADQDAHIGGYAFEKGRPIVILLNKWDLVKDKKAARAAFERDLALKMSYLEKCPWFPVSALTGRGLDRVFPLADRIMAQFTFKATTAEVNRVLEDAVTRHSPPQVGKTRLKFYYATQAGTGPPSFVLFANRPKSVHFSYRRFLANRFREAFGLDLVPARLYIRGRRAGDEEGRR